MIGDHNQRERLVKRFAGIEASRRILLLMTDRQNIIQSQMWSIMSVTTAPQPLLDLLMADVENVLTSPAIASFTAKLNLEEIMQDQIKPIVDSTATQAINAVEAALRANVITNGITGIATVIGDAVGTMLAGVMTLGAAEPLVIPVVAMVADFIGNTLGQAFSATVENFLLTQIPHKAG